MNTATKVWRWNSGGLGYSSTGYNGPYSTAVTMDGQIVADFISAGTLQGIKIIGDFGTIGGFTMSGNSLTAEWSYTYPEFTEDDALKVQAYIIGQTELTDDEKKKYDVNFDCMINSFDALRIQKIADGLLPRTATGTVTIGSSDATEVIKIVGTSGAVSNQELSIGLGGIKAAGAVLNSASIGNLYDCRIYDASHVDVSGSLTVNGTTTINGYLKEPSLLATSEYFDNGLSADVLDCYWYQYSALIISFNFYANMQNCSVVPTSYFSTTSQERRVQYIVPNSNNEYVEVYQKSDSTVYVGLSSTSLLDKHLSVMIWGI